MAGRQCAAASAVVALLLVLAAATAPLGVAAGGSVLVLLQDAKSADGFSQFLGSLRSAGFTLDVRGHRDSGIKLREYGAWAYDHLLLLAPKAESERWVSAPWEQLGRPVRAGPVAGAACWVVGGWIARS